MPQVGPLEIMMVAVVALIVFGPEKLPEIARTVGKALADFRRAVEDAKGEFQSGLDFDEDEPDDHPIRGVLTGTSPPPYVTGQDDESGDDSIDPSPDAASSPSEVPAGRPSRWTPIPMTLDKGSSGEESDQA
jgi:sec-independent protein translocase protein TatB